MSPATPVQDRGAPGKRSAFTLISSGLLTRLSKPSRITAHAPLSCRERGADPDEPGGSPSYRMPVHTNHHYFQAHPYPGPALPSTTLGACPSKGWVAVGAATQYVCTCLRLNG